MTKFNRNLLLADGTLNVSQPRADGKPGSAFYGTLPLNVAELLPLMVAAQAAGEESVDLDVVCFKRTRKADGVVFYGISSQRVYRKAVAEDAESEVG